MTDLFNASNGACFSPERRFRYSLWRIWDATLPRIMFVGLNPSTANEDKNDPTIRRVMKFASTWGFGGVYMVNVFPLVSPYPEALQPFKASKDPDWETQIEINDMHLKDVASKCSEVIFAWGAWDIVPHSRRDIELTQLFPHAKALVINKDGSPRHPLYVLGSTVPTPWLPGREHWLTCESKYLKKGEEKIL